MNEALAPGRDGCRRNCDCEQITTVAAANRFLREEYINEFNQRFSVRAAERGTAFVPVRRKDLDLVFSLQHERVVARDNTVSFANRIWQLERTKFRATLAGCRVTVHEHLDQTVSRLPSGHIWSAATQLTAASYGNDAASESDQSVASRSGLEKSGQKAA